MCFQPGDGRIRDLLRDCKIFPNLRITVVSSSTLHGPAAGCWPPEQGRAAKWDKISPDSKGFKDIDFLWYSGLNLQNIPVMSIFCTHRWARNGTILTNIFRSSFEIEILVSNERSGDWVYVLFLVRPLHSGDTRGRAAVGIWMYL